MATTNQSKTTDKATKQSKTDQAVQSAVEQVTSESMRDDFAVVTTGKGARFSRRDITPFTLPFDGSQANQFRPSYLTVDTYGGKKIADLILRYPVDKDVLSHTLASDTARNAIIDELLQLNHLPKFLETLFPGTSRVTLDVPSMSPQTIGDMVAKSVKDTDLAFVLTDMITMAVSDFGLLGSTSIRDHYTTRSYNNVIPDYDTFVTELKRMEIRKLLDDVKLVVPRQGRRYENANIIRESIIDALRQLVVPLRRVGLNESTIHDIFVLLKANVIPTLHMSSAFPSELVDHNAIVELAEDFTFVNIALSMTDSTIQTSEIALLTRMSDQINKIRALTRFKKMSIKEYTSVFSKTIVRTGRENPLSIVVSRNVRCANAYATIDSRIFKGNVPNRFELVTNDLLESLIKAAFADTNAALSIDNAHRMLVAFLNTFVDDDEYDSTSSVTFNDVYTMGGVTETDLTLIAMMEADEVYIMYDTSVTDGSLGDAFFAFSKHHKYPHYLLKSGTQILSSMRMIDPAEVLLLSQDFDATGSDDTIDQHLPPRVFGSYVYSTDTQAGLKISSIDKKYHVALNTGSNRKVSGDVSLLAIFDRPYLEGHYIVHGERDLYAVGCYAAVFNWVVDQTAMVTGDRKHILELRNIREVIRISNAINPVFANQISKALIAKFIAGTTPGDRLGVKSALNRAQTEIGLKHIVMKIAVSASGAVNWNSQFYSNVDKIAASSSYLLENGVL